jgi:hypothetical protein
MFDNGRYLRSRRRKKRGNRRLVGTFAVTPELHQQIGLSASEWGRRHNNEMNEILIKFIKINENIN